MSTQLLLRNQINHHYYIYDRDVGVFFPRLIVDRGRLCKWGLGLGDIAQTISQQDCLSIEADHSRTGYTDTFLRSCDLDLDPMTALYKLDV